MAIMCLTLTGRVLVINFMCDVMHTPTYFLRTAIIEMYVCVAGRLTSDYLWNIKATLDSYSFIIHERVSKDRVKVSYTTCT